MILEIRTGSIDSQAMVANLAQRLLKFCLLVGFDGPVKGEVAKSVVHRRFLHVFSKKGGLLEGFHQSVNPQGCIKHQEGLIMSGCLAGGRA